MALGEHSGWQLMNYDHCQIVAHFGHFPSSMNILVIAGTRGSEALFNEPNDGFIAVEETQLDTPYYFSSFPFTHGELLTARESLCCMRNFLLGKPESAWADSRP